MKTLRLLKIFLVSSFVLGCSTNPKPTPFDGDWVFVEIVPGVKSACSSQASVTKLRTVLLACEAKP